MTLRATYPRLFSFLDHFQRPVGALGKIGDQTMFWGRAIAGIPYAVTRFRIGDHSTDRRDQPWVRAHWR